MSKINYNLKADFPKPNNLFFEEKFDSNDEMNKFKTFIGSPIKNLPKKEEENQSITDKNIKIDDWRKKYLNLK